MYVRLTGLVLGILVVIYAKALYHLERRYYAQLYKSLQFALILILLCYLFAVAALMQG